MCKSLPCKLANPEPRTQNPEVSSIQSQVFAFTMFACAMPDSPVPLGTTSSPAPLLAWLVLASVAEGAMAPVVYELAAELTLERRRIPSPGGIVWFALSSSKEKPKQVAKSKAVRGTFTLVEGMF